MSDTLNLSNEDLLAIIPKTGANEDHLSPDSAADTAAAVEAIEVFDTAPRSGGGVTEITREQLDILIDDAQRASVGGHLMNPIIPRAISVTEADGSTTAGVIMGRTFHEDAVMNDGMVVTSRGDVHLVKHKSGRGGDQPQTLESALEDAGIAPDIRSEAPGQNVLAAAADSIGPKPFG